MHSKLDLSGQQFKAQSKAQRLVFCFIVMKILEVSLIGRKIQTE